MVRGGGVGLVFDLVIEMIVYGASSWLFYFCLLRRHISSRDLRKWKTDHSVEHKKKNIKKKICWYVIVQN